MTKKITQFLIAIIITFSFIPLVPIFAADPSDAANSTLWQMEMLGEKAGFSTENEGSNLPALVGYVVNIFFSVLGIIFIIIILMAGFNYMMARGEDKKVSSAIATIRHAVIGLIILIGSYAIYIFVWSKLTT